MPRRQNNITSRMLPDGSRVKRVRIRRKGAPEFSAQVTSQEEAITLRDRQLGRLQSIKHSGADPNVTVREAIASYKQSDRFKALTRLDTTVSHLNYWDERFGVMRLADISGPRLADERDRLLGRPLAGASVHRYLSTFNVAWEHACEKLGAVPTRVTSIRWPKISREPPAKFTTEQLQHLLKRADEYAQWAPLGLFVRLSMITTQRKITVLGILWAWVDRAEGTIEVPKTKSKRAMSLPIEGETLELLRAHHARELAAGRGKPDNYVFESPKLPQPMEPKKHIDWLFDDQTLGGKTFKHLRSTSLSRLFTHAKLDLPRVMSISGHKTARVLLEHYAFADDEEKRQAIRVHAGMLLGR